MSGSSEDRNTYESTGDQIALSHSRLSAHSENFYEDSRDWIDDSLTTESVVSLKGGSLKSSTIDTTLEEFVPMLQEAGLAGPVSLIGVAEKIGQGGQFTVWSQGVVFLERNNFIESKVAIKRPRLSETHDKPVNLADYDVQRKLKHLTNEIKALTHVGLRQHPNIVELLSWAFEDDWVGSLVLVLEWAPKDLERYLTDYQSVSPHDKARFCDDIANGLDAIHDANFVHGDLKPANVLVFRGAIRPVAKLADFGFAGQAQAVGGTAIWQAPELKSSVAADQYSFGLLVWSITLLNGACPPHASTRTRRSLAMEDVAQNRNHLHGSLQQKLIQALSVLLEEDPAKRPRRVSDFFAYTAETSSYNSEMNPPRTDPHEVYNFVACRYPWEAPAIQGLLLKSLYSRVTQNRQPSRAVRANVLLAMGLHFTLRPPSTDKDLRSLVTYLMETSAAGGDDVACAIASRLWRTSAKEFDTQCVQWMRCAVKTGSIYSRYDLQQLSTQELHQAKLEFQELGGYNQSYWNTETVRSRKTEDDLHQLAAFGTRESLDEYLGKHPTVINSLSDLKETALYLACARGSWDHVKLLLDRGADASISCTESGISCLHWIIAFKDELCDALVESLVHAGADINMLSQKNGEIPFPHYPFVLPAGSPLHWAVTTSHHGAVEALIKAGVDPTLRNGSDAFMYDDRVRHLYAVGGPNAEGCTFAEAGCLGLSALDVAAIHRDPFLFELLAKRRASLDMNSADEEGFTVLHRLANDQVFRTSRKVAYSPRWLRITDEPAALRTIIKASVALGAGLERLTSDAETAQQKAQRPTDLDKTSYTPLMLAVLEGDEPLVEALLECGANVHTTNQQGTIALFHTSHRANAEQPNLLKCMSLLIAHGADVNHSAHNHRSALLNAASSKLSEVTDFLLAQGGRPDERDNSPRTATPGKSIFAFFASTEDGADEIVMKLLARHVFDSGNAAMVERVVKGGAANGSTLLHEFAAFAMPRCCRALLAHGAEVNALAWASPPVVRDGVKMATQTPLDALKWTRDFKEKMMKKRQQLTDAQGRVLRRRWDEVVGILVASGGLYAGVAKEAAGS